MGELHVMNAKAPVQAAPAVQRSSRWVAPLPGNAKMNIDAVVSKRGYGSVGVICRDQVGAFLGPSAFLFQEHRGPSDPRDSCH